jgi:hypothetical protein
MTQAELLLEQFCRERGIDLARIPEAERPTPDYEMAYGQTRAAVEVKQLEPNPEDQARAVELETTGRTFGWVNMRRAKQSILDGTKQLRSYAKGRMSGIVALHDTMGIGSQYLSAESISRCMYGPEVVHLAVPRDPAAEPLVLGSSYGGGRVATEKHNTTLSAVAVLRHSVHEARTWLLFYHNLHAAMPLAPDDFRHPEVHHYAFLASSPELLPRWQEV